MTTIMQREALESPLKVQQQLSNNKAVAEALGKELRDNPPSMVMIVGRGSSDHAGVYGRYLIEIETGTPTFAAAPSVSSIYNKDLKLTNALIIAISQSGKSPDILAQVEMAKRSGARVVALVNDESSPLADIADTVLGLGAGPELAVAATKSYLCTLSALAQLTAYWSNDAALIEALNELPTTLQTAIDAETQLQVEDLLTVNNLVVLGRGPGFAVSKEIALKLKEVCQIQAEPFSSAEFLHGPVTLVENEFTCISINIKDESQSAHLEQVDDIRSRGASILEMDFCSHQIHPRLQPIAVLQRFYLDVEKVALARGIDPDAPAGLNKVTRTL